MRAIKIDSENRQIYEVNIPIVDDSVLEGLYKEIGCSLIEVGYRFPGNIIWIDEEGLLNNPEYFFKFEGAHQPFAGNGIVLGDIGSDSKDTILNIEDVKNNVTFMTLEEVRKK